MSWLPRKCVVVPVDFSDTSLAAAAMARQLVEADSDLLVVHVLPAVIHGDPGLPWNATEQLTMQEQTLAALQERLSAAGLRDVRVEVLFGDPGHEIAQLAQDEAADLIVLPSHGRSGLTRLLIGSVAERVTRLAHCPVLVLRS